MKVTNGLISIDPHREEWRPVVNYEGIYEVSDHGRVRRVAGGKGAVAGRVLKPRRNRDGYMLVGLCHGGEERKHLVHRLVAEAFFGPIPAGREVDHINGRKHDCRALNLRIVTKDENIRAAYARIGTRHRAGERNGSAKLTEAQVREVRRKYAAGGVTQRALAREYGVSRPVIGRIVRGRRWTHVTDDEPGQVSCAAPRPRPRRVLVAA